MTGGHWLAVFGLILGAWVVLYAMSLPSDLRDMGRIYGAEFWVELCSVTPDAAGYLKVVLMWAAMSAAMMAPTFLPALTTYDDLTATQATTRHGFYELLGGYLVVWLGFSVFAAAAQMTLSAVGLVSPIGQSLSDWFSVLLLLVAGIYQFSPLKEACLSKCRMPLTFFMQHWSPARWNAATMGLRLGLICLGCCWALMALAFVGGAMNLIWMGLATLIMVFEKLPEIGRYVTRPLGVALIGGAIVLAVQAIGLF